MKSCHSALMRLAPAFAATILACSRGARIPEPVPSGAARGVVEGTATSDDSLALPNDAIFEARLLDVSRRDAPGTVVGQAVTVGPLRVPISFVIPFDPALIDPERRYAVRTRIHSEGRPLWVSDRAYRVLTNGAGSSVNIVMRRMGSADYLTPRDSVVELSGEFAYLADVARLTECSSRRVFPVSTEGDFPQLLRTYMQLARPAGTPTYVTLEGFIANRPAPTGSGTVATVVVRDFIGEWPNQTCASAVTSPVLSRTPWQITVLQGNRLTRVGGHEQPRLQFQRDSLGMRYSATVGCNGIGGRVEITGDKISFEEGIGTMRSCGSPLDSLERQLREVLDRAATWQIRAKTLRLRERAGATLGLFEALRMPSSSH